ncbi:WXG100 family type VII secretion target [Nocardia puris]|uniref:WXG100 family type VII secretion target n=1 Tax=Nocardia puris TaxID=208602 RepID=A0A366DHB1_9NOCA|nr:WXG100 family type VII secretion target [Nocardia puris]MBF6211543.1 WXG100 family type VII secretion target [Nocardia puris]MBF6366795.1 WXG100 family type VII secretion target [Nocardia puris]MBF6461136.1 WXG100 family type VII secretion target [Nocardia puris]RBO88909.1 WXG100 family type VII secretion target [Nocardia puris]
MTGQTSFTEKEAADVVNEFMEAISGIQTTVRKVEDSFNAARAGWEGDAAVKGQQVATEWQDEAVRINQKIEAIKEVVFEGNQTYSQIDPDNVEALTNLV